MDATSPIALLAVERDDYLPLNAATVNILTNIMGMMTSRNRCEEIAASQLSLKLMNAPNLESRGGTPVQPNPGNNLTDLRKQGEMAKEIMDRVIPEGLRALNIDPGATINVERTGKEMKSFRVFTGAPLKTEDSCSRKIKNDYKGDHSKVCDIARCSIVVEA